MNPMHIFFVTFEAHLRCNGRLFFVEQKVNKTEWLQVIYFQRIYFFHPHYEYLLKINNLYDKSRILNHFSYSDLLEESE